MIRIFNLNIDHKLLFRQKKIKKRYRRVNNKKTARHHFLFYTNFRIHDFLCEMTKQSSNLISRIFLFGFTRKNICVKKQWIDNSNFVKKFGPSFYKTSSFYLWSDSKTVIEYEFSNFSRETLGGSELCRWKNMTSLIFEDFRWLPKKITK